LSVIHRRAVIAGASAALALTACGPGSRSGAGGGKAGAVRLGYQKNGVLLVAKTRGVLEQTLISAGVPGVQWVEFPSGPPLLEALAVGSIDLGATGDIPPIFSQAAGAPIRYVAQTRLSGKAGGVIVPARSTVRSMADLRGKKFCFTRGSSAHNSAVLALQKGGLTVDDVEAINLGPADAAAAFARGKIDAWVIWDPYFTLALRDGEARNILGLDALGGGQMFYLANTQFTTGKPEILKTLLDAMVVEGQWCLDNTEEVARIVSRATGLEMTLMRDTQARADFKVEPLSDDVLAAQQATADLFAQLEITPKPVIVREAAWRDWKGPA
jgi:sulfonate transport system substrate-binding protein